MKWKIVHSCLKPPTSFTVLPQFVYPNIQLEMKLILPVELLAEFIILRRGYEPLQERNGKPLYFPSNKEVSRIILIGHYFDVVWLFCSIFEIPGRTEDSNDNQQLH